MNFSNGKLIFFNKYSRNLSNLQDINTSLTKRLITIVHVVKLCSRLGYLTCLTGKNHIDLVIFWSYKNDPNHVCFGCQCKSSKNNYGCKHKGCYYRRIFYLGFQNLHPSTALVFSSYEISKKI